MKIFSKNIQKDGYMHEDFGGNSKNKKDFMGDLNVRSFHIGWKDVPPNTKTIAIFFFDYDSIPVCGFPYLHWAVANIDPSWNELKENASVELKDKLIQGLNSNASPFFSKNGKLNLAPESFLFAGSAPPNADHIYNVEVFAVKKELNLRNGFFVNELMNELRGNVLEKRTLIFKYKKVIK